MKTSKLFGGIILALTLIFSYSTVGATNAVSAAESRMELVKKIQDQNGDAVLDKVANTKMMKIAKKASKLFGKRFADEKVDFQTEPDRWMWFWIFGWVIGFVLFFVPFIFYLGWLFWTAGTVCLVIWILKKTGNM
jgi:hypothetical protein